MSLTDIDTPPAQMRHAARRYWLDQQAEGVTLTGRELAEVFARSERWGLERIREAKAEADEAQSEAAAARLPGEVELSGLDAVDDEPESDITVMSHEPHAVPHEPHAVPHEPHAEPHATASEPHAEPHGDRENLLSLIDDPSVDSGGEKKPHGDRTQPQANRTRPQAAARKPHEDRTTESKSAAPHLQHKAQILKTFYVLVLTLALIGQTTAAAKWVPIGTGGEGESAGVHAARLGIAAVFSLVLELGGLVMLLETVSRAATGTRSRALPLLGAFCFAGVAGGITFVGHWGPAIGDRLAAVAFLLVTLAGLVTLLIQMDWRVRPEHARRANVERAVRAYVKGLDMPAAEKEVLLSSVDADTIAARITNGLDNETIADRLAEAISPQNWTTQK